MNKGGSACYKGRLIKAGDKFRVTLESDSTRDRVPSEWIGKVLTVKSVVAGGAAPIAYIKELGTNLHIWDSIEIEFITKKTKDTKLVRPRSRLEDLIL